jgi:RelA/SpoT family (p)ppGpp synthetase
VCAVTEPIEPSSPPLSQRVPLDQALDTIVSRILGNHPGEDGEVVRKAFAWVERHHASTDGAPLVPMSYALDTGQVLADLRLDPPAVAAALVAPVVVEDDRPLEAIREELGAEVATLLEGVKRLATIRWDRIEEEAAESLRKMFLAMAQDVRVVMVVLAMRVQRMRTLREDAPDEAERERYAQETLDVFAPLANRLGIWQLKWELEDWALRELEPETFAAITKLLAETRQEREAFIDQVLGVLKDKLGEEGIEAAIKGRPKHVYSIYKKMQRKQVAFDQLYDVSAVRAITDRVQDCYGVLGLVHATWLPVPAEFDDYIARPKDNGYQSLHTAVIGPEGRPFEVQIRTHEMHQFAEFGVAAHWAYKERRKTKDVGQDKFMLLRQLMDWERDVSDPHQFVESLKTDIFEDQVYVFTPNGDVIDLPSGATPLDFAYRIHTMVGHRCKGAKVNGQIVTLDHRLTTGDRIEILTHKHPKPSRDWMNPTFGYLKTSSARQKIRGWFRKQGRDVAIHDGRELVDKELSRLELHHATIEEIAQLLKYPSVDDLYTSVGYGDRSAQSIASAALHVERDKAPPSEPPMPPSKPPSRKKRSATGLRLDGVDDVLGKRARCCNPVPGDAVLGFVTRGRGIVIHRRDCKNITQTREPERLVEIDWGPTEGESHSVDVEIHANDRAGLMGDLSRLVTNAGVNITSARAEGNRAGHAWIWLSLDCRSADQVAQIIARIGRQEDVLEVRRVGRRR